MIAAAARHRYLVGAGAALVAVAAIIAVPVVVVTDFLRELREAFERIPLSVRWHLQRLASTRPTESVVLYFQ